MATDNKQKVLIRSMSYDELMNYLCNSDLNGKIIPKNKDTWHQNYDTIIQYSVNRYLVALIIQNQSKLSNYSLFCNRFFQGWSEINKIVNINKTNNFATGFFQYSSCTPVFRPLIEYKE